MSNLDRILDRARKLEQLSQHTDNEAEAALAASRLRQLMEAHQLSDAMLRLDEPSRPAEEILTNARLEPDAKATHRKRVAWKTTIYIAVATDLGIHTFLNWKQYWTGNTYRYSADVRAVGRETAIQTWRYVSQYLWRQVEELADAAADRQSFDSKGEARAWKNSFRAGCASKIAQRIVENRQAEREQAKAEREAALKAQTGATRESLALSIVERDQVEVDDTYEKVKKGFTRAAAASIGSTSGDGYGDGCAAGERVVLGKARAGLPAGQGRLKGEQ
jgi:hypothetical protein